MSNKTGVVRSGLNPNIYATLNYVDSEIANLNIEDKADLIGGKIPVSQLPSVVVSEFLGDVGSELAMLALEGQSGDWCIRTDTNQTFILIGEPSSVLANWKYIVTPSGSITSVNGQTGVVVLSASDVGAESTIQLDSRDNNNRNRSNHTGTQAISTITSLQTTLNNKADLVGGVIPVSQLPSYVDDVLDGAYINTTTFNDPFSVAYIPESGKIYVDTVTNTTYRWSGSIYVSVGSSLALGETISSAYRGDRGKIAYEHSQLTHDKTFVGLGNVDNTSDVNKPISSLTQTALNTKTNIKVRTSISHTTNAVLTIDLDTGDIFDIDVNNTILELRFVNGILLKEYIFNFYRTVSSNYQIVAFQAGKYRFQAGNIPTLTNMTGLGLVNSLDIYSGIIDNKDSGVYKMSFSESNDWRSN